MDRTKTPVTLRYLVKKDELNSIYDRFIYAGKGDLMLTSYLFAKEMKQHSLILGYHFESSQDDAVGYKSEDDAHATEYRIFDLKFYDPDVAMKFKLSCDRPCFAM